MKITTVQMDIQRGKPEANLKHFENLLNTVDSVGDIVLAPELFTTGYLFDDPKDIQQHAETFDESSPTLQGLQKIAKEYACLIIAGIAEKCEGHHYNSAVVIASSGLQNCYRKIALTSVDHQYFQRGNHLTTFTHQGVTFGIAICLDLWYPEIIRRYVKKDIDVLLHPANFGGKQSLHVARARAIENGITVITCNRVGSEKTKDINDGHYRGESRIIAPSGQIINQMGNQESIQTVWVDIDKEKPKRALGIPLTKEIQELEMLLDS